MHARPDFLQIQFSQRSPTSLVLHGQHEGISRLATGPKTSKRCSESSSSSPPSPCLYGDSSNQKKVRLYSSSLQLLFEQKMCKSESDRVAGKPGTPCDCAGCVKKRGLMRSSPSVGQSSLSPFLSCFFFPVFSVVFSIHVL